jgi:hypothetical protein
VFENIQPTTPVYATPYVLGGMAQRNALNTQGTAYQLSEAPSREIGLDLKYPLTSNMTLDVTLNTDFAQAEADDQQINLTRFPLFFPEKRQEFSNSTLGRYKARFFTAAALG